MANLQLSISASERNDSNPFRVPKSDPDDTLTVQSGGTYTVDGTETYSLVQNAGTLQVEGTLQITGGTLGYVLEDLNLNKAKSWYVHIENGWDVSVDATIIGSHLYDKTMDDRTTDGSAVTIASGETDFFDGESGHSVLQTELNPASTPSSGECVVTLQVRKA